jgi:AmiR/NasT family two-component response regulator
MKTVDAAYNGHANSYVIKPFDMEGLYALLESIESFWVRTARLPSTQANDGSTA